MSNEAKHTPGPWRYEDGGNARTGQTFAVLTEDGMNVVAEGIENENDARLIAAAPDLLGTLKALTAKALDGHLLLKERGINTPTIFHAVEDAWAVIAEAEGR